MDIDSMMKGLTAHVEAMMPFTSLLLIIAGSIGLIHWIGEKLTEAFKEEASKDQRKKKKNDYLDYYDNLLSEQDQGDPAIAYYDEVISEEMRK